jgi:hypothetical protein
MDDIFALGSKQTSLTPTWASINVQGSVKHTAIGPTVLKGLTYNPKKRLYYTIDPSPTGPRLCSLSVKGALQTVGAVAPNLTGGIAYRRSDDRHFAVANDKDGVARFHALPKSGQDGFFMFKVATGVCNGLAYVDATDTFYAVIATGTKANLFSITTGSVVKPLFPVGTRVLGGLAHSPLENLFYFIATDSQKLSHLWTVTPKGALQERWGLGFNFNHAGLSFAPWYRGSIHVKGPIEGERFVKGETTKLDAEIVNLGGVSWNSEGITWESDLGGKLGSEHPEDARGARDHGNEAALAQERQRPRVR